MCAWDRIEPYEDPLGRVRPASVVTRAAIIAGAAWFIYAPVLHGGWLWDDGFVDHPLMRDPSGWWGFWFEPPGPDYFPLTSTLQWLIFQCFGKEPLPFHAAGLALHVASCFLFWRLLARLGVRFAWTGALLFAVHPVAVESVAWVSELKNTLSLPLVLLAMLSWLNYDERGRSADYLVALVFFLAAMLAKTSVVMLPVVLLLYAWWKYGRIAPARMVETMPFFALSLIFGLITVGFQWESAIGLDPVSGGPLESRVAGAGQALLFYTGKIIFPFGLLPMYPQWDLEHPAMREFFPWAVVVLAFAAIWLRRRGWGREAMLGIGFFAINLTPILGFATMSYMRYSWVADHFVYFPMLGLLGLVAVAASGAWRNLPKPSRPALEWSAAALVFVLAWQSRSYAENFRHQTALWSYNVQQDPAVWMSRINLGMNLDTAGRYAEAESLYRNSFALREDFFGTYLALANTLSGMGRKREALGNYAIAVRLAPHALSPRVNYGYTLSLFDRLPEAKEQYVEALRFHPDSPDAHYNLAFILLKEGRTAEAAGHFEEAARLNPALTNARDLATKLRAASPVPP